MKNKIWAFFAIALLVSCNENTVEGQKKSLLFNELIELDLGACISDNTYELCVDSVSSDSRCPSDVICAWEGNAAVIFTLKKNDSTHQLTLNTNGGNNFPKDTIIEGLHIKLAELAPYPKSTINLKQKDYTVSFIIEEISE